MEKKTIYVASDSRVFYTEEECIEYEKKRDENALEEAIHCFIKKWGWDSDSSWANIDSKPSRFFECQFIVFDNPDAAKWYKSKMAATGRKHPFQVYPIEGFSEWVYPIAFLYRSDLGTWVDWRKERDILLRRINSMTALVCKDNDMKEE